MSANRNFGPMPWSGACFYAHGCGFAAMAFSIILMAAVTVPVMVIYGIRLTTWLSGYFVYYGHVYGCGYAVLVTVNSMASFVFTVNFVGCFMFTVICFIMGTVIFMILWSSPRFGMDKNVFGCRFIVVELAMGEST